MTARATSAGTDLSSFGWFLVFPIPDFCQQIALTRRVQLAGPGDGVFGPTRLNLAVSVVRHVLGNKLRCRLSSVASVLFDISCRKCSANDSVFIRPASSLILSFQLRD
jgi:hypothetical protein